MRKLISKLSDMRAISGFEYRISSFVAAMFKEYADEVEKDSLGSVIAIKRCGKKNAPSVMIEAHMDEIGLIVTSVTEDGLIKFSPVGGVDERMLPSLEVTVHGKKDIWGVITISDMPEDGKTAKMKALAIDTAMDAGFVKKNVSVGDSITIAQSVGRLGKKQWSGKSLDDRAGVAALIDVMKRICGKDLNVDVYAVAAVQEEVGCRGAKTASFGKMPDMAIAVDVTHGITPDNSKSAFECGSGAVIAVGPNLHPRLSKRLVETAEKNEIKYETEVEGGDTGTDAWEMQVSGTGIPTALISIPLKYMHTSVETLRVSDVKAVSKLLAAFIEEIGEDTSWINY